jgi:hypothetical protein
VNCLMPHASAFLVGILCVTCVPIARASDHLDSPAALANPAADIADMYAWTAGDARHLNLIMTLQGHAFSDKTCLTSIAAAVTFCASVHRVSGIQSVGADHLLAMVSVGVWGRFETVFSSLSFGLP